MSDRHPPAASAAALIEEWLPELVKAARAGAVLDLACGSGQNGLRLAEQGAQVVFADRNQSALDDCRAGLASLPSRDHPSSCWSVDFEAVNSAPLSGRQFSVILVFRYLHRPLIPAIRDALMPGGLIVYETFTTENRKFGRPNNADYLLNPGELRGWFDDWEVLHYAEPVEPPPIARAVAQLVARKPENY